VVLATVVEDGHHGNGVVAVVVWAPSSEQRGRRRALKNDIVEAVRLCVVLADHGEVGEACMVLADHGEVGLESREKWLSPTCPRPVVVVKS
jgi:hypothetical protein